ncbi:helix-turn-helix domain-containing protein [Lentibacillus salinarum]|uniref:Helix-turn-helix domain-containing protein n=1 Tax=Lentibacillus salinarum TaxID=446820 RepID=A0ABW3ZZG7_9BACI
MEIAKKQGKYTGRSKKYHANATGKDKLIYDEIVKNLSTGTSVMDIHRRTGVARSTIYSIKHEITDVHQKMQIKGE